MKGMAYIPFAVLAASAMFLLALTPMDASPENTETNQNSLEAYNLFHESGVNAYSERLNTNLEQYVDAVNETLGEGDRTEDADNLDADEYVEAEFESEQVLQASMNDWVESMDNVDEYSTKTVVLDHEEFGFDYSENTEVLSFSVDVAVQTEYDVLSISRSSEELVEASVSVEDYENIE